MTIYEVWGQTPPGYTEFASEFEASRMLGRYATFDQADYRRRQLEALAAAMQNIRIYTVERVVCGEETRERSGTA